MKPNYNKVRVTQIDMCGAFICRNECPIIFDGRPQDAGTREITLPHKSAIRSQSPLPLDNGNDAEQTLSCAKG